MKILVTGCAGYIGSVLTQYLLSLDNVEVIGVDGLIYPGCANALLPYLGDKRFEFHQLCVTKTDELAKLAAQADVVIPLAGIVGAPACDKNPGFATAVNYTAIHNLLKRLSSAQCVLYPNTNSGYGATDGESYCTEESPLTPVSLYGKTKCDAEKAVLDHENSYVFRLATVFGSSPRMRFDLMVNDFVKHLAYIKRTGGQSQMKIYEGHFKRNFVHVRDVAGVFTGFCQDWMQPKHRVFNIGNPDANMSKLELAHTVCELIGLSKKFVVEGDGRDPDQRNYLVSSDRILEEGFNFRHPLEFGIFEVAKLLSLFLPSETLCMRNY